MSGVWRAAWLRQEQLQMVQSLFRNTLNNSEGFLRLREHLNNALYYLSTCWHYISSQNLCWLVMAKITLCKE